ncbi:hypothetical protein L7F22_064293 [Adiantum nelumboides]|nr:hypothetical protein [Adiantum nelumboides]
MARRGCRLALPLERRLLQSKQRHGITLRLHSTSSSEATATSVLANNVDANSADFEANRAHMSGLIADLDKLQGRIALGGPEKARLRHVGRGKMLARDRVGALLDPGSPFIEVGNLAGWNLYESEGEDAVPCAGVVAGIGLVEGNQTMVVANDPTVKAGAYYPITVKKHLRAQRIARENRLPCVYMTESAGAALPYQADVFPDELHFGRIFAEMAQMSALGIPQISIVHGISVAGGAYVPAMADETIIVRKQGTIFLAGPPLVKAALGEVVDDEVSRRESQYMTGPSSAHILMLRLSEEARCTRASAA